METVPRLFARSGFNLTVENCTYFAHATPQGQPPPAHKRRLPKLSNRRPAELHVYDGRIPICVLRERTKRIAASSIILTGKPKLIGTDVSRRAACASSPQKKARQPFAAATGLKEFCPK